MAEKKMLIKVEFRLPAQVKKEGDWWASTCSPLDIHSQGRTREEALTNLSDVTQFFIESCVKRGTIFDVLREAGFVPGAEGRAKGARRSDEGISVSVPVPFVRAPQRSAAHA